MSFGVEVVQIRVRAEVCKDHPDDIFSIQEAVHSAVGALEAPYHVLGGLGLS